MVGTAEDFATILIEGGLKDSFDILFLIKTDQFEALF